MIITDTDRLDFITNQYGVALVSDDNGHWAMSEDGMQNVPETDEPIDIVTTFIVDKDDWFDSPREAIDSLMNQVLPIKEGDKNE